MTTDDAVRERHGVACRKEGNYASSITVYEGEEYVHISGELACRQLTQWQARYLAAKLYRLSRRLRQRQEAAS